MDFTQIKETCLYVSKLGETRRFYHDQLGMPVISQVEGRHIFFRVGSSVLLCFIAEVTKNEKVLPPHFASGKQHIAFEVEQRDYLSVKQQCLDRGIEITCEQKWPADFESFYFEDPDGHVLEIVPAGMWE